MGSQSVFVQFDVYNRMRGGTLIAWQLNPQFDITGPITFSVYASRPGVDDSWTRVATATDTYVAEDTTQWLYGKAPRLNYQIRFTQGGTQYESDVRQILFDASEHDKPIIAEIIRKETLRLTKFSGRCGWLYKRRRWGTPCTECTDYNTGEVTSDDCAECYGTGYLHGYFEPVFYWFSDAVPGVRRRAQTNENSQGVIEDRTWSARGINCPWLDTGDVWIDHVTDQRYVVQTVQELVYRKVPILFDPVELRLAPVTDIVYSLVRPDDEESSSSS